MTKRERTIEQMKPQVTIKNWQQHTINIAEHLIREQFPDCRLDQVLIFTGTVINDESGRYDVGWHCKTSPAINYDRENGIVETRGSIYVLEGPSGDKFPDLGAGVLKIFY